MRRRIFTGTVLLLLCISAPAIASTSPHRCGQPPARSGHVVNEVVAGCWEWDTNNIPAPGETVTTISTWGPWGAESHGEFLEKYPSGVRSNVYEATAICEEPEGSEACDSTPSSGTHILAATSFGSLPVSYPSAFPETRADAEGRAGFSASVASATVSDLGVVGESLLEEISDNFEPILIVFGIVLTIALLLRLYRRVAN